MRNKALVSIALVVAFILLVPLIAMQFTAEVVWDLFDFAIVGVLLFASGLTYELVARKGRSVWYRAAVSIAVAASVLLVWMNMAVGIIGDPGGANLMYIGVLAIGIIGACIARFRPHGMTRALYATALAQIVVAMIVLVLGLGSSGPIWPRDVLIATGFFATLWVGSALLFGRAANAGAL